MKSRASVVVLCILLAVMAGLMLEPVREETATVDETTFMGGGYAYLKTGSTKMAEANPLLNQMLAAAPMLACRVHLSEEAQALMEMRAFSPVAYRWQGPMEYLPRLFAAGVDWSRWKTAPGGYLGQLVVTDHLSESAKDALWYNFGLAEAQEFGRILVYDPQTDADTILTLARLLRAALTLATTAFVYFWARRLSGNAWAGLLAAAIWGLSPMTLAYGHLVITEPGIALAFPVAVWWMGRTVEAPTLRRFFVLGVLGALALQMKFLALMLGPALAVLFLIYWLKHRASPVRAQGGGYRFWLRGFGLATLAAWLTILLVYFPHWRCPPPIDEAQARVIGIPGWFQTLRPLLVPRDFFKALTTYVLFAKRGQGGFLYGEWSPQGWWYYYPVALFLKTPIPILLLMLSGLIALSMRWRSATFASLVPWSVAVVYLVLSMTSKVNIGVRHMLPALPLIAVGAADQIMRLGRKWQIGAAVLIGWTAIVAAVTWPDFIPYSNEFAGGTANGYRCLVDSNYDWGQDGKRLKRWMDKNAVDRIYLDFFGTQPAIEWLRIPNQRVNADVARNIRDGVLVVSVSSLMHPEWGWLREGHRPYARIGYTLFVYKFQNGVPIS